MNRSLFLEVFCGSARNPTEETTTKTMPRSGASTNNLEVRLIMTTTKLLTIPEFANATGISETLARTLVNRGDVPSIPVGRRRRVDARWVEKWTNTANPPIADRECRNSQ